VKLEEDNIRVNQEEVEGAPHDLPKTPAACKERMMKTNEAIKLVSCRVFQCWCAALFFTFSLFI
jgi:hypothetical protein